MGAQRIEIGGDRSRRLLEDAVLIGICVSFALANGLAFGVSNHYQYLLHGLHALNSQFLAGDWFTCSTLTHHAAFTPLMMLFAAIGPLPLMFGLANAVAASVVIFCIHAMARRWFKRPLAVTALAAFLLIVVPRPYVGMSSMVGLIFQPSTIGAVGVFAGLVLLSLGRTRNAGLVMGIASIFHINYMVWAVLITGAVVLLNYRGLKARGALWLLTPLAIAVLYHTPFIMASRTAEQVEAAKAASWILHDMYMPYHSRPYTWGLDGFVQFAAVMLVGGISIAIAPPRDVSRMAKSIAGVVAAIVLAGMLLTTIWRVDTVALLFPYRLTPFLIIVALLLTAGALVHVTLMQVVSLLQCAAVCVASAAAVYVAGAEQYGLVTWCTVLAILLAGRIAIEDRSRGGFLGLQALAMVSLYMLGIGRIQLCLVCGVTLVAMLSRYRGGALANAFAWRQRFSYSVVACALAIGFLARMGLHRKDRLGPPPSVEDAALYEWCRSTPAGTQFVVPPDLAGFRLNAGRAVVIDWKCMPILPADTLTWYRRLVDEAGVRFTSMGQCLAGYRALDAARAEVLAERYRAEYVVTRPGEHVGALDGFPVAFSSPAWRVYRITGESHEVLASDAVRDR